MNNKSKVIVDSINISGNSIEYRYRVEGEVIEAFAPNITSFKVNYSENVESVPYSIAIIPFVTNVLPIAWVYGAELIVAELDKDFFENVADVKKGYVDMYPNVDFEGTLRPVDLKKNVMHSNKKKTALLFSGGVDATSSLVTMLEDGEKPHLITLWGSDVALDDIVGWKEKSSHTKYVADIFGLNSSLIESQFRIFLNEGKLSQKVKRKAGDMWWHGFQHGIGLIGHVAPLIHLHGFHEVHIAATFTRGHGLTCASDPTIDEHIHVGKSQTIHNGFDLTRQQKIHNIHRYMRKINGLEKLPIKVCWKSKGAKNCGHCEKCMRTASGIIAEGGAVEFYDIDKFDNTYMKDHLIKDNYFTHTVSQWSEIQDSLRKENIKSKSKEDIKWLLDVDFGSVDNSPSKKARLFLTSIRVAVSSSLPAGLRMKIKSFITKQRR